MQAITTPQVDDTSAAGRISCAICTSLLADHPDALETVIWAKAVKEVYLLGRAWVAEGVERGRAYRELRLLIRARGRAVCTGERPSLSDAGEAALAPRGTSCSSLCWCRGCLPTITWRSGACVHWSSVARSVGAPAVRRAVRPAWSSPACFRPGQLRAAIPWSNAVACSKILTLNSEQYQGS